MITLIQTMISTGNIKYFFVGRKNLLIKLVCEFQIGHKFESTETINITLEPGIW